ncbi:hypothetical protein ACFSMW_00580 [Virgibacillus halophilus]
MDRSTLEGIHISSNIFTPLQLIAEAGQVKEGCNGKYCFQNTLRVAV